MTTGARFRPALSSSGYAGVSFPPVRGQQRCLRIWPAHACSAAPPVPRHSVPSPLSASPPPRLSAPPAGPLVAVPHPAGHVASPAVPRFGPLSRLVPCTLSPARRHAPSLAPGTAVPLPSARAPFPQGSAPLSPLAAAHAPAPTIQDSGGGVPSVAVPVSRSPPQVGSRSRTPPAHNAREAPPAHAGMTRLCPATSCRHRLRCHPWSRRLHPLRERWALCCSSHTRWRGVRFLWLPGRQWPFPRR